MATGKVVQQKQPFRLPKEMPSNIQIIKNDQYSKKELLADIGITGVVKPQQKQQEKTVQKNGQNSGNGV